LLNSRNIKTAYDFAHANEIWVKKNMTVMGLRTLKELNRQPCIELEYSTPAKKAIMSSRSFGKYVTEKQELKEAVALYTTRAAEKLRKQGSVANMIMVYLRTNPFKDVPQYHNGVQVILPVPTCFTNELIEWALKGVDQIYKPGYMYQKAAVMLAGLIPATTSQFSLFDVANREKLDAVTKAIDQLNHKMGSGTVTYAATGIKRDWKMKREIKSPSYTTNWKEIPIVKAFNFAVI
jgi:DNA polymerase V